MNRVRIISLAAVFVLMAGAGAATIRLIRRQEAAPGPAATAGASVGRAAPEPEIEFEWQGVLDYFDERGFTGSSQTFVATDGVVVSLSTEEHGTARRSGRALQEAMQKAHQVTERAPVLDPEGRTVGERVVASFRTDDAAGEHAAVLRSEGGTFDRLESPSLRHILLLEARLFKGAGPVNVKGPAGDQLGFR